MQIIRKSFMLVGTHFAMHGNPNLPPPCLPQCYLILASISTSDMSSHLDLFSTWFKYRHVHLKFISFLGLQNHCSLCWLTMRPETMTKMIGKQLFCATDVRAIGKLTPRQFLCVIGAHRKYLMEASQVHKITQQKLCSRHTVVCNKCPV